MGQNLVLNLADHGYSVAVYNRSLEKTDDFVKNGLETSKSPDKIIPFHELKDFVASISRPRRILLMVKAGASVDAVIKSILPYLEKGDLIADLGNSYFKDSERRITEMAEKGILYAGVGVSGGEEGARRGPSIMPGGGTEAKELLEKVLVSISAEASDASGKDFRCCRWTGGGGSGHFVKMVHNGIEYGDMQIISEAFHLMCPAEDVGLSRDEAAEVFKGWNNTELSGFLNEITAKILTYKDTDGKPLVDKIVDAAGQKGTGKWTVEESFNLGQPVTVISEAVFARALSSVKDTRVEASKIIEGAPLDAGALVPGGDTQQQMLDDIKDAMLASRIISYAQGFAMLRAASAEYDWKLDMAGIAEIWQGGCIIRSYLLNPIKKAFEKDTNLKHLLFDDWFVKTMKEILPGWRRTIARAALWGIPVPGISSALAYFDGFRTEKMPANLIQAQRDYFGGHMYERTDKPRGEFFHTDWTGHGGTASSTAYNV